jgi:hypothetical protein
MIPIALSFRHDRGGLLTPGLTARAWFSPPTYSWTMASSIAQTIMPAFTSWSTPADVFPNLVPRNQARHFSS